MKNEYYKITSIISYHGTYDKTYFIINFPDAFSSRWDLITNIFTVGLVDSSSK